MGDDTLSASQSQPPAPTKEETKPGSTGILAQLVSNSQRYGGLRPVSSCRSCCTETVKGCGVTGFAISKPFAPVEAMQCQSVSVLTGAKDWMDEGEGRC